MTSNFLIGFPDVNFEAGSLALTTGTVTTYKEDLKMGARGTTVELDAAQEEPWQMTYTLSSVRRAEFLAIIRADLAKKAGVTTIGLNGSTYSRTLPSSVSGLQLWYDATYGITIDSSRRCNSWTDRSSNAYSATQSTDANKPLYSRADNKENLCTYSEDLSNAIWVKTRSSVTSNATKNGINFTDDADKVIEDTSNNTHTIEQSITNFTSGVTYRFSCYVKSGERSRGVIQMSSTAFAANPAIEFNLGTGTIPGTGGGAANYTITSVGNSWYRLSFEKAAGADGTGIFRLFLYDNSGNSSYAGDGASGIYLWGVQVHSTAADSTYCRADAVRQFRGVNGKNALVFIDSTHYLSLATYTNLSITGNMSIFAAVRPLNVAVSAAPQSQTLINCATGSTSGYLVILDGASSNAYYSTHYVASSTTVTSTTDSTVETPVIWGLVRDTGTATWYKNNTADGSGATTNPGSPISFFNVGGDGSGREFAGYICELLIYNAAVSSADRTSLYEYLSKRWTEAPIAYTQSLDTETLVGPRQEDWIYKGTESSSYLYFYVTMGNNDTSIYTHSKEIFGQFFDFGRDPLFARRIDSEAQSAAEKRPAYRIEMMWEGITNTKRNEFLSKIGRYHRDTGVVLYCDTNLWPLLNNKMMYCRVDSIDFTPQNSTANSCRIVFEELI